MMTFYKAVKDDMSDKWGVCDNHGCIVYDGDTFDTKEQAQFVADFHNRHPDTEWERDVMPAFDAKFPPQPVASAVLAQADNKATPAADDAAGDMPVIRRLKELHHEYWTANLTNYGKDNLVAIAGEMLIRGDRNLQSLIDMQADLAAATARAEAAENVVKAAQKWTHMSDGAGFDEAVMICDSLAGAVFKYEALTAATESEAGE